MASSAQIRANRKNAKKSTGPGTAAGKATVAANARHHGISGGFTILAHEDPVEFQPVLDRYRSEFKPASEDQRFLVETMAQSGWTLARARRIEGHLLDQLAGSPVADDPDARIAAQLIAGYGAALATVQRYATTAELENVRGPAIPGAELTNPFGFASQPYAAAHESAGHGSLVTAGTPKSPGG